MKPSIFELARSILLPSKSNLEAPWSFLPVFTVWYPLSSSRLGEEGLLERKDPFCLSEDPLAWRNYAKRHCVGC
ncbi:hypothetical protein DEO72_LG6g1417 [Vigna unguiculata]|uniref:Uncharacterized protein n=1 Tax=Vigna unguiculata TaxID=3917 RepID=A0A4D6M5Q1_VIGUN|nr:hypothetical protein DEO72_LG6g1417 [Vigna unguiculata]